MLVLAALRILHRRRLRIEDEIVKMGLLQEPCTNAAFRIQYRCRLRIEGKIGMMGPDQEPRTNAARLFVLERPNSLGQ